MAAATSLASTIDRNFLECGICFEIFDDPRALPCLHVFCCGCLDNWATACSNDMSIVSCPLCKKICAIPEDGVQGFPVDFRVKNLRDTVSLQRKKKDSVSICPKHSGREIQYFCATCRCAACSDCCVLDPTHRGHTFCRLGEAPEKDDASRQYLTDKVQEPAQWNTCSINQTDHVLQDLKSPCPNLEPPTFLPVFQPSKFVQFPCTGFNEIRRKKWKQSETIKTYETDGQTTRGPISICACPNGDIAVTSDYSPVCVLSRKGGFKHALQDSSPRAQDIANTPSNHFVVPGKNGFHRYNRKGILIGTTSTYDLIRQPSTPNSVAIDSNGTIILGMSSTKHKTVSIHQSDGKMISKFQTRSSPRKITCTPDDKLLISFSDNTLQVMDQSGLHVNIIWPPQDVTSWMPMYLCCSKQGELFVGNQGVPKGVYRYVSTHGVFKYFDCIVKMGWSPWGIALSTNEDELFVVNYRDDLIQIFQ